MICNNCGQTILDDSLFCTNCGYKLTNENNTTKGANSNNSAKCSNCQTELGQDSKFCTACGTASTEKTNSNSSSAYAAKDAINNLSNSTKKLTSKLSKNQIIAIAITVVVLISGAFAYKTLCNTPIRVLNKFCASMSKKDIEKALTYTTTGVNSNNTMTSAEIASMISSLEKELNTEYREFKIEVLDNKKQSSGKTYAAYNVILKLDAIDSTGKEEYDCETTEITFTKIKGKWYVDFDKLSYLY